MHVVPVGGLISSTLTTMSQAQYDYHEEIIFSSMFVKIEFSTHVSYDQCLGHSWYLAADMQLFILSPLFIYPLWRWRRAGLAWAIFVLTSIIIAIGILFIAWSLPVTELKHERWYNIKNRHI